MVVGLQIAAIWLSSGVVGVLRLRKACDGFGLLLLVAIDRAGEGGDFGLQCGVVCHAREY
jgi:hypothetical protein